LRRSGKAPAGSSDIADARRIPGSFIVAEIGMAIGKTRRWPDVFPREGGPNGFAIEIVRRAGRRHPEGPEHCRPNYFPVKCGVSRSFSAHM
jgi:hypothetical protein